jgi:hypothetical protein
MHISDQRTLLLLPLCILAGLMATSIANTSFSSKAANAGSADYEHVEIDRALDTINTEDLTLYLALGSGEAYERNALLGRPEVKLLIAHSQDAIPAMLSRLNRPGGLPNRGQTLTIYFVVFGQCNDPRVLPAIANYFDYTPVENVSKALWYDPPFLHAIYALHALLPSETLLSSRVDILHDDRKRFADEARAAYRQIVANPSRFERNEINKILVNVDTDEFKKRTAWGYEDRDVDTRAELVDTVEAQYLIRKAREAVPTMLSGINAPERLSLPWKLTVYFAIFSQCHDPRVLLAIADYLDGVNADDLRKADWYDLPFPQAIFALHALLPSDPLLNSTDHETLIDNRQKFADEARAAYRQYVLDIVKK